MKCLIGICCAVFLLNSFSAAQIRLQPSGGCGITERGTLDCSWPSAMEIRKPTAEAAAREKGTALRAHGYPTTQFNLAPGAPLIATSEEYDRILVALTEGRLVNEATQRGFNLLSGSTLLLSKGEKYPLRNAGEGNLAFLVILIR
jgi:hypothetical protein